MHFMQHSHVESELYQVEGRSSLRAGLLRAFTAPEMVKGVRCGKCCAEPPPAEGTPQPSDGPGAYTQHIRTVSFGKVRSDYVFCFLDGMILNIFCENTPTSLLLLTRKICQNWNQSGRL